MHFNSNDAHKSVRKSRRTGNFRLKQKNRAAGHGHSYELLEPKKMLAGISLNAGNGELTVWGDNTADVGSFEQISPTDYRATINGSSQDFSTASVTKIIFIGFDGDDTFTNSTSVESLLLGNGGNDTLNGGSGIDQINGGSGNNQINGGAGNDRMYGGSDNDTIYAGQGDDFVVTGDGTNFVDGEEGNDLIFGGNNVDTIYGGEDIDQIFALDGDDMLYSEDGGVYGSSGASQADLILGLGGNDSFWGGDGLNIFYGGDGEDTMVGGLNAENRFFGQGGNDTLTGGDRNDLLSGHAGNDIINGLGAADFIIPSTGNDTVDAGTGNDFVIFNGNFNNFQVTGTGSDLSVRDTVGGEGTDQVVDAETFRFSDGDQVAESGIIEVVTVQPIIVSNNNGSNTAEFFGNASQESDIMQMIDDIYYQAGVDVVWLTPNNWNDTFANVGNSANRPQDDLDDVVADGVAAGVANSNSLVINMYFVEVAAGFSDTGEYTANGLAYVGGNGITMHVGDQLPTFTNGQVVVAEVSAHEIAHNLGLVHVSDPNNLMSNGDQLNAAQIATILASPYTVPV